MFLFVLTFFSHQVIVCTNATYNMALAEAKSEAVNYGIPNEAYDIHTKIKMKGQIFFS